MKILAIGNSFSEDACRYIHKIAAADGQNIKTVNLYIGGVRSKRIITTFWKIAPPTIFSSMAKARA